MTSTQGQCTITPLRANVVVCKVTWEKANMYVFLFKKNVLCFLYSYWVILSKPNYDSKVKNLTSFFVYLLKALSITPPFSSCVPSSESGQAAKEVCVLPPLVPCRPCLLVDSSPQLYPVTIRETPSQAAFPANLKPFVDRLGPYGLLSPENLIM